MAYLIYGGSQTSRVRAIGPGDTINADDYALEVNATAGSFDVALPPVAVALGRILVFTRSRSDVSGNPWNVVMDAGDGGAVVFDYTDDDDGYKIQSNGTVWRIE